ncbi:hypothetical protein [Novosphingobium guangzhouense]|uniref:Uncharacterized protein n=1 Tax=Novosphingobium guangzhouense TaxID=1850347 RepID=A0A2K2G489_9SPHN|nr:hypothetical protein [Novosphingobium guangzhouense]PNU05853.1 hypothetical protein A8V01_14935 [Novosphingobium guangzhouense]
MADLNPFVGLRSETHIAIETMLSSLYNCGEWGDQEEQFLAQWREARGDDAMAPWRWWVGSPDSDEFAEDAPTREKAIEIGRRDYAENGRIEIIEARTWNDDVEGEENCSFAESRNREVIDV